MQFVVRKVLGTLVLVWLIVTLTFLLTSLIDPRNVASSLLGPDAAPEQVQQTIARLGLDQPLWVRYADWMFGAARGDLGTSWFSSAGVAETIAIRFPVTLSILICTIVLSVVLGLIFGVSAAVRGGVPDRILQFLSVLGFAVPNIVIAIALIYLFALQLHWFPATGYTPIAKSPGGWILGLVLPTAALSAAVAANLAQQIRGSMVDQLRAGYVRTLRSRGLSATSIIYGHALRNALPAGLHALGVQVIYLAGGAVLIERIFALPGMGSLITDATARGDIPVVLGTVAFFVVLVVIINLLIDLAAAALNPKVRTS